MKILLLVDDYVPDSTKIAAKMMHELALQFIEEGNQVTVLTPGAPKKQYPKLDAIKNLTIHRFYTGKIKNTSKLKRALNESLLSFRMYLNFYSKLKNNKHDLIVYYSPTIFFGPFVSKLKKKWGCPSYLILRDFFPQWAVDQNMLKEQSIITKYFRFFEHINYKSANYIAVQSPNNLKLLSTNIKVVKKLKVLYNWTNDFNEESFFTKVEPKYKPLLKIEDKVVFFYGGNIGKAQDMMNLVRLAKNMIPYENAHFVFVGLGDEVEMVKKAILDYNLTNVSYLGSVNQVEYNQMLSEFDIGLFSLHKLHSSHNFPGKLLGYMANNMPILGSVNPNNDLQTIVETGNAGLIAINGEDEILINYALKLLNNRSFRLKTGKNAYQLLKAKFSAENATQQIINHIKTQPKQ